MTQCILFVLISMEQIFKNSLAATFGFRSVIALGYACIFLQFQIILHLTIIQMLVAHQIMEGMLVIQAKFFVFFGDSDKVGTFFLS